MSFDHFSDVSSELTKIMRQAIPRKAQVKMITKKKNNSEGGPVLFYPAMASCEKHDIKSHLSGFAT